MNDGSAESRRTELTGRFLVLALAGIFVLGLLGFIVAVRSADSEREAPQPTQPPDVSASLDFQAPDALAPDALPPLATASQVMLAVADPRSPTDETSSPTSPASVAAPDLEGAPVGSHQAMPVAAVAGFWSTTEGLSRRDVVRALETGLLPGFRHVIVEEGLRDALSAALGVEAHPDVESGDVSQVARVVRRGGLGLVRAADLAPSLRALRVDGRSLVGNDRVQDLADWPLLVTEQAAQGTGWDHDRTWVLVAGGNSFTDRGVYDSVVRKGRGVDYPFDGGTARVTGHGCCDPIFGDNVVPRYVLTGNRGAVRRLFKGADLAIANHEMPATRAWEFHRSGTRFSGRPDLTRIFERAGIDWLSLANNHIKDYGTEGILDTRRVLRRSGIAFGGAGSDLAQARRISYLDVRDTKLALIGCVGVAPSIWAGADNSGATPCLDRYLVPDIKAASRRADVVLIVPHWGVEYTRQPLPSMRKHAARWVRAGADLVLGGHSHVAGAIEEIDGVPVLYSLGNLIFDQPWSTDTMESALLEATFHGGRLLALNLRPYIIHGASQPNLLDPGSGEGRRLIRQVRAASADWLDW